MAIKRRYTGKPLQVDDTPETMARIEAIADRENLSQAAVVRDLISVSLPPRERLSKDRARRAAKRA